ncbi:MAG: toll/interleukin-1 receptor domain-containing protein [Chloroflexi bacterium]|nr:MAG: toll/interleukin-1 receptor domain-containing protein [Chloroflexota bacterium]
MNKQTEYLYDVFISYSQADREWVNEWLLPHLEKANLRVAIDYQDFLVGSPEMENIERVVSLSHRTIVVLTPAWLSDEWNAFEALLVRAADPAARQRKLQPILLKPCDLPDSIAFLNKADLTIEDHWHKELRRLTRSINDEIPQAFPKDPKDFVQWRKWLRYRRRQVRWAMAALLVLWVIVSTQASIKPFQTRSVWLKEDFTAPNATLLHNTGTVLVIGGRNSEPGCRHPHQGLWYRPLSANSEWQISKVDADLCIEDWGGAGEDALSDIVGLASLPTQPDIVYALSSDSGLLISEEAAASFQSHPASKEMPKLVFNRTLKARLVVTGLHTPVFWIVNESKGVWVYRDEHWLRLDEPGGCDGLSSGMTFLSLLVMDEMILMGTESSGLWVSEDNGRSCRQVFDTGPNPRYDFVDIWNISTTHHRFLALVRDWNSEPDDEYGNWQLLDLCPRANACDDSTWEAETEPVWFNSTFLKPPIADVLVQQGKDDISYKWHLVSEAGQVWQGDITGSKPENLPDIWRCYNLFDPCTNRFEFATPNKPPYLLAADHVYQFTEGPWWKRLWP